MTKQEARSSESKRSRHVVVIVAIVSALGLAFLYTRAEFEALGRLGFPLDDSWIHLQFARQVAGGAGLAYRGAEMVTGSTSPLWTVLLSLLTLFPLPIILAVKALGVALFALSAISVWRLCRALDLDSALSMLAVVLFLFTDWMVWSALSGMEILLAVWLSLEGVVQHVKERLELARAPRSMLLLGLAALARPECLLLLVLAVLDRLIPVAAKEKEGLKREGVVRRLLVGVAVAAVPLLVVGVINQWIGGSPFPQTLAVKTEGVNHWLPPLRSLWRVVEILFRPQPFMALLAAAGALALFDRLGTRRDSGLLPAMWLFGLPAAYATMSPPGGAMAVGNFGRYFFPLLPFVIVLGVVALESAVGRVRILVKSQLLQRVVLVSASLLMILPSAKATIRGAERYTKNVFDVETSDVAAGRWLRENVHPDAVLAVQDVGAVGYLTPNPLVDMAGITTPEILPYIKGEKRGEHPSHLGGLIGFLRERQVDYIVLFPESYGGMDTLLELEPGLRPIYERKIPGNITMAGSRLLVLSTPWGEHPLPGQPPMRASQ